MVAPQPAEMGSVPLCLVVLLRLGAVSSTEERVPMPETMFSESITDIDGEEAGEVEMDVSSALMLPGPDAPSLRLSQETEWRVLRRVGVVLEAGTVWNPNHPVAGHPVAADLRVGASWALLHLAEAGFHVQLEGNLRLLEGRTTAGIVDHPEFDEAALPMWGGIRAGLQRGAWTLRSSYALEMGLQQQGRPRLGMRTSITVLCSLSTLGFVALDVDVDTARSRPLVVAPSATLSSGWLDLPFRLALGLPVGVGLRGPWWGGVMVSMIMDVGDRD